MLWLTPALFLIGVVFGWYIVVPPAIHFLVGLQRRIIHYLPRASDYIHFIVMTLLAMGFVFELPVVMMMLGRVGILRLVLHEEALARGDRRSWPRLPRSCPAPTLSR